MRQILFLVPLLMLSACSTASNNVPTTPTKTNYTVYLDNSEVTANDYKLKVLKANSDQSGNGNCDFSISISVKNLSIFTREVEFKNMMLIRENNYASYKVDSGIFSKQTLDSEIEGTFSFTSKIPSSLKDDNYFFAAELGDIAYKVLLYETPNELREDLTVTYMIEGETVHTETVKKGRTLPISYVYDSDDHQAYASIWKDSSGVEYKEGTKIEENVIVTGSLQSNVASLTTDGDIYTYITGISHVHPDGKVVILDRYFGKEICLTSYAIHGTTKIKEVYLPVTLHEISNGNFSGCGNLKTIFFAGTKEQWDAIPKPLLTIPTDVDIIYNTSFN